MPTSSKQENNLSNFFELEITTYLVTSVEYEKFVSTIKLLSAYWAKSELTP